MSAGVTGARDGESRRARRNQLVLFSALAAAALAVFALWLAASGGKAPAPGARIAAELAGPGTAEDAWTRRSEARLGTIETRLREMEAEGRRLAEENRRLQDELSRNAEDARAVIDRQAAEIERLGREAAPGVSGGAGRGDVPARGRGNARFARGPGRAAAAARAGAHSHLRARGRGLRRRRDAGREAALGVAPGGEPCSGRGARGRRRVGGDLRPGRSAPGAPSHHRSRLDRGRGRDGPERRPRGLHGDRRRVRRSVLGEGLRAAQDADLRGTRARHGGRDRGRGVRRERGQDRGARAGGEPRGGARREGVPRRARLRSRPGGGRRVPAAGGRDRLGRGGREHGPWATSAGRDSARGRPPRGRRSRTTSSAGPSSTSR